MSFSYDAGVLASLYGPLLPPWLRRLVGAALCGSWPRVRIGRSSEIYVDGWGHTPLEVVEVRDGQDGLENAIRTRQWTFQARPPFDVALFELRLSLLGAWEVNGGGIVEITREAGGGDEGDAPVLIYRDHGYGHRGRLLGPGEGWPLPPYGFPALYGVWLDDGRGVVWLRRDGRHDLRIVWKPSASPAAAWERTWAQRAPDFREGPEAVVTVSFLMVQCFHCYADGYCYYPLAGDLVEAYQGA